MVSPSRTLSVSINRPTEEVYGFVANPENLPRWAPGLCTSVRKVEGGWVVETPQGPLPFRFEGRNSLGVLDHYVTVPSGEELYMPMRVVANGGGSELLFTLFRLPEMTDEQFAADADLVQRDMETLKELLESR